MATDATTNGWTLKSLHETLDGSMEQMDRRYCERFEALNRLIEAGLVAQREAFASALAAADKAVTTAMTAAERAVLKAEAAADKRFDAYNEQLSALEGQRREFMPRSEAELQLKTMAMSLAGIESRMAAAGGSKAGGAAVWGYVAGGLGLVVAIIAILSRYMV